MKDFPNYDEGKESLYISSDVSIPRSQLDSLQNIKKYLETEEVSIEENSDSLLIKAERDYAITFEKDVLTVGYFENGTIYTNFYNIF